MKKIKTYTMLALLLGACCLASCKKSDSNKQQADLLTSASWKITARDWLTTDGRWVTTPSGFTSLYAPTMTFFDNGTYNGTYLEIPLKLTT